MSANEEDDVNKDGSADVTTTTGAIRASSWQLRRSFDDVIDFDRQLHSCVFDRKFSFLPELKSHDFAQENLEVNEKQQSSTFTRSACT